MMYHSRNSSAAPWVNNDVVKGTLRKVWGSSAAEISTNAGGSPADTRLPSAMTSPHTSATSGAKYNPTEAMPSVANSDALMLPSW